MKSLKTLMWVGGGALLLGACQPVELAEVRRAQLGQASEVPTVVASAGVPVTNPGADSVTQVQDEAKARFFPNRRDAFALLASERAFDREQMVERLLSDAGGFGQYFTPQEEDPAVDRPQPRVPVPEWRLAGIVFSQGVTALLELPPTFSPRYVDLWPGRVFSIPIGNVQTEWQVISINDKEVRVRLISPTGIDQVESIALFSASGLSFGQGGAGGGGGAPANGGRVQGAGGAGGPAAGRGGGSAAVQE